MDGRLYTGDEIVSVDGQSVVNTSHHHVVQLMGKAAVNGAVTIGIRRRIPTHQGYFHLLITTDTFLTKENFEFFGKSHLNKKICCLNLANVFSY